jgi:hypothetical protein
MYFVLLNECKFSRSDVIKIFANNIMTSFSRMWNEKVEELEMVDHNRQKPGLICFQIEKCTEIRNVTVSHIRKSLLPPLQECLKIEDKHKIQNIDDCSNNQFILAWKTSIATGIRSFKFRLLHIDIFSKSRLQKIKLVENNFCDFCLQSAKINEDINHLLCKCPGSRETWDNLQQILTELNIEYQVSLKSIIIRRMYFDLPFYVKSVKLNVGN